MSYPLNDGAVSYIIPYPSHAAAVRPRAPAAAQKIRPTRAPP